MSKRDTLLLLLRAAALRGYNVAAQNRYQSIMAWHSPLVVAPEGEEGKKSTVSAQMADHRPISAFRWLHPQPQQLTVTPLV